MKNRGSFGENKKYIVISFLIVLILTAFLPVFNGLKVYAYLNPSEEDSGIVNSNSPKTTNEKTEADKKAREDDNLPLSPSDCSALGMQYDTQNVGTRGGRGCVVTELIIKDDNIIVYGEDVLGSSRDLVSKANIFLFQTTNGVCPIGFEKGSKNGIDYCELKDKSAKNAGRPPSSTDYRGFSNDSCKEAGGRVTGNWFNRETSGSYIKCDFFGADGEKIEVINSGAIPDVYYVTNPKCAEGYKRSDNQVIKDLKNEGKKAVYQCTKEGSQADVDGKTEPTDTSSGTDSGGPDKTSCSVEWTGWVVCPGARILTGVVIKFYELIAENFLKVRPQLFTESGKNGGQLKDAWKNFVQIANILLAIFIIAVVLSQITGYGISNYGIKKMLPRILVFAVVVNISWYITVAFVDISNILGKSLFNLILSNDNFMNAWEGSKGLGDIVNNLLTSAVGLTGVAVGVTVAAATVGGGSIMVLLFLATMALMFMWLLLVIRQGLIVVAVVLSPIAFVSAILPNTESFFNKWKNFLKGLLIVYPTCSVIVAGMIFASNILSATADGNFLLKGAYMLLPLLGMFSAVPAIKSVMATIDKITGGNLAGMAGKLSGKVGENARNSKMAQDARVRNENIMNRAKDAMGNKLDGVPVLGKLRERHRSRITQMKVENTAREEGKRRSQEERTIQAIEAIPEADRTPGQQIALGKLRDSRDKETATIKKGKVSAKANQLEAYRNSAGGIYSNVENEALNIAGSGSAEDIEVMIKAVDEMSGLSGSQKANILSAMNDRAIASKNNNFQEAAFKSLPTVAKYKDEHAHVAKAFQESAASTNISTARTTTDIRNDVKTWTELSPQMLGSQSKDNLQYIEAKAATDATFKAGVQDVADRAYQNHQLKGTGDAETMTRLDNIRSVPGNTPPPSPSPQPPSPNGGPTPPPQQPPQPRRKTP